MTTFYSNYVRLCAEKGKSASGVAREIGLSNAAANGWKNGKEPSDITLQKLSAYFGVPVSELLDEKEKAPTPEGERTVSDEDIKFALFGGDGDITDAMFDEVKRFARMVKLREEAEKKKE